MASKAGADDDFPSGTQAKVAPGASVAVDALHRWPLLRLPPALLQPLLATKWWPSAMRSWRVARSSLPMATAYILEILPRPVLFLFKLSSPIQIIGSIFADRPWSVGAEVGRFASMVPVNITVTDEGRGVTKVFHCKVVNHPQLTPDLVTASIMSSLDSTFQSQTPYIV